MQYSKRIILNSLCSAPIPLIFIIILTFMTLNFSDFHLADLVGSLFLYSMLYIFYLPLVFIFFYPISVYLARRAKLNIYSILIFTAFFNVCLFLLITYNTGFTPRDAYIKSSLYSALTLTIITSIFYFIFLKYFNKKELKSKSCTNLSKSVNINDR